MRVVGWILIATGVVLAIWGASITTTIHNDATYLPTLGYQMATDTYNLGLLQRQMMLLQSGLALFVAGTVAACVGDLRAGMRRAGTVKYEGVFETEPPMDTPKPAQTDATE